MDVSTKNKVLHTHMHDSPIPLLSLILNLPRSCNSSSIHFVLGCNLIDLRETEKHLRNINKAPFHVILQIRVNLSNNFIHFSVSESIPIGQ